MSFAQVALEDFPSRLWMLDGDSPFLDHSHFSSPATSTSTARHAALIKGAQSAVLVGNTNKLIFDAPIMKRGREYQPFSIEVTFRRIRKEDSAAQQQIFGTASVMDGLVIAGTVLSFSTKYTNTGEAKCEYDLQENRAVTAVAVHTDRKNSLYVNGDLVAEVEITPEQRADTFLSAGTSLSAGTTTSTNLLALNGLAIYERAMDEPEINTHYLEASDTMDEYTVGAAFGGVVFSPNSSTSNSVLEYAYNTDEDWHMGRLSNTTAESDRVIPQAVGGISMAGSWEAVVPLPPDTTLSFITMDWSGIGATVQTSIDGNTWYTERRAAKITPVGDGFTTEGRVLYVRATFPGGIENDESYFSDLSISMYGGSPAPALENRNISLLNASIEADHDVIEYNENWGLELNSGWLVFSGASTTNMAPQTVQVWAKGYHEDFLDTMKLLATSWYTNDGTYSQDYQTDEWQLRTYVFPGGFTGEIAFAGTGQIGTVLLYPYPMTKQQVKDSYTSFTGIQKIRVPTNGAIEIADLSDAVEIYEYDWSISSAG